ncbi:MAG: phosphodiesterase/alkaline phosphatase D-like protein [Colwellia sp.]
MIKEPQTVLSSPGDLNHSELIDKILKWDEWHYSLNTSPKIVVLDTRTQRWYSESNAGKSSGLMDWQSLSALQQALINEPNIIMVSAAPIYGVKLIETIQRIFTFWGKPLAVDAENWMAHSGTANVMLNIFRHNKTPPNFIILSGDVHYSFVYKVTHRFRRNS